MDIAINLEREEQHFISACIRQERWAQERLYKEYYGTLMPVCMRYANTRDEARDILHEGFIKIYRNLRKYKPGTSLSSWMRRIMVNTAIDYYRKSSRRRTEDLDQVYNASSKAPTPIDRAGESDVMAAIAQLSPAYRVVFNLYVIEGYSHKEIADQLGINESTSRSNLVKARTRLKEVLAPKHTEHGR